MPAKLEKQIIRLYNEVLTNGIEVKENEEISNIVKKCEEKGQFIFNGDSYWSFVKTIFKTRPCIRMVFTIKDGENGKVHNIEKITDLIKNVERILIFVDHVDVSRSTGYSYVDIIKFI